MRNHRWIFSALALLATACRGEVSQQPPIHLNPNMDSQKRLDPQQESDLFPDKRAMRPIPEGTVAVGFLKEDDAFYRGKQTVATAAAGKAPTASAAPAWVTTFPIEVTNAVMLRGQQQYTTYCQPCHGPVGSGDGMVVKRGYPPATNLHEERIRAMPVGEIFNTVSHGIRNMPGYASQIVEADRWALIVYLRALQRSQYAKLEDLPPAERDRFSAKNDGHNHK